MGYIAGSAASNTGDTDTQTTLAVTLGAAVAVGDIIVGMAGCQLEAENISTVTDSLGNVYTPHGDKIDDTTNHQWGRTFHSLVTVAGTPTITVTYTASLQFRRVSVAAYGKPIAFEESLGNWQSAPGTGTDAITSGNITTDRADDICIGFTQNTSEVAPGTGTLSAGTSYTSRNNNGTILMVEDRTVASPSSIAATFTHTVNVSHITHIVVVQPSSGAVDYNYRQFPKHKLREAKIAGRF